MQLGQRRQPGCVGRAEQRMHVGDGDLLAAEREELLQQRLAVAHRAGGPAGDDLQRFGLGLDAFGRADLLQAARRSTAVSIGAKSNRWQRERTVIGILSASVVQKMNFTCSGGSSSVLSSALNAWLRQHVHFVDDVDLEAGPAGADVDVAAELADFVDAAVAGAVDLDHVDVARRWRCPGRCRTRRRAWSSGPFTQFSALAKMRAVEVLPTPRAPVNR